MTRPFVGHRRTAARSLGLLALCCGLCPAQVNILTANGSNGRTNSNLQETQLSPATVTPDSFGKIGSFPVDGQVYAQVLYVSALSIPGRGTRDVLIVCTMHNSVYAFDADAVSVQRPLWQVNLGPSVPSSVDIDPEIGILSTGTIDLERGVLYVVSETLQDDGPSFSLHALDLRSGAEKLNGPTTITATVAGTGAGAQPVQTISLDATHHIQRPGLLLANGSVYIAFGSHADQSPWHGWIISYDASDVTKQTGVFMTTPTGEGGAIWQSGRGLAADEVGNIYAVTGNGDYDGTQDFGESFLKLPGTLGNPIDWHTPTSWQFLSDNDVDLSGGPALIEGTHTLIGADKAGELYVLNGDAMGHLSSDGAYPVGAGYMFNFAVWSRPGGAYVFVQPHASPVASYEIDGSSLSPSPVSTGSTPTQSARIGMTISADGANDQTGILWEVTSDGASASNSGTLHAFNASNLAVELWNSDMSPDRDALGALPKFVSPTVANGRVYTPTFSNTVAVYGLTVAAQSAQRASGACNQRGLPTGGSAPAPNIDGRCSSLSGRDGYLK
ncbi:MAG: hypothetical protein LAP40_06190 [Acidobacteriia bacterium]|nr:hypothetical protein [Terriglobia bacterium]